MDADEKWFYVISGGGRLKIPADAPERPKTLLKSKRFVAKSKLVVQLAQSPDTNGCDLGLFRSVDTHIPKFRPFELDAFARMVSTAHQQCPGDNVERLYETKIVVCKKLAQSEGDNSFDLHHRKKSA